MAISQERSVRKPTGGRFKGKPSKKIVNLGSKPTATTIDTKKKRTNRVRGNNQKSKLLSVNSINVFDPKTKKFSTEEITKVLENSASAHFVRRNILTKGAIVDTKKGKAKVTSRPGQEGTVSGVLV